MRLKQSSESLIDDYTENTIILVRDQKKFKYLFDLLLAKEGFKQEIEEIRKKWKVNVSEPKEKLIENSQIDIDNLLNKYNLKKNWRYILSCYICFGEFEPMADPNGIEISVFEKENYGIIKIIPNSKLTDVKKAFTYIKSKLPKKNYSRNRIPKNNEEDLFINELREQNKPYKEIKKILVENCLTNDDEFNLRKRKNKIKKRINKNIQ